MLIIKDYMKRIILLFIVSILFFTCSSDSNYKWFKGNLNEAMVICGDKIILLDFYAKW